QDLFSAHVEQFNNTLPDNEKLWLLLGDKNGPLAWFALVDVIRPGAKELIQALKKEGIAIELLSGDQSGAVAVLARELTIEQARSGVSPADKLARLQQA